MGRLTNLNPSKPLTETDLPAEVTRDSEVAAAIDAHIQGPDPHNGKRTFSPTIKSIGSSKGPISETYNPLVNRCGLEVQSIDAADAASMDFHRPGLDALHFGLDNNTHQLSVGGWSMGGVSHKIYHEGFGNPVWQSPSDSRLKQKIREIPSALQVILDCRPVSFVYNQIIRKQENLLENRFQREKTHYWFIANDFPLQDLVWQSNDGYLGINYVEIVPFLCRAIQEQQQQIEDLKKNLLASD